MQSLLRTVVGIMVLSFAPMAQADVELSDGTVLSSEPYYVVTYVEVAPSSVDHAVGLIKDLVDASKTDEGNIRFEAAQRLGRENHFAILEAWVDQAARDAHAAAKHTTTFRQDLQPHLYNPYDERLHVALDAVDPATLGETDASSVVVVTHVDIIPPEQFPECSRQVDPAGPCGNALVEQLVSAGRTHPGNVRFDALTQANRPNHMTIVEVWGTEQDQAAHTVTDDVKMFRDALSGIVPGSGVADDPLFVLNPLTGSLYDERMYKLID
jgi:quinol monooxygenase YgiN